MAFARRLIPLANLALSRPRLHAQIRTMASATPRKHEFLVIVPDKPGTHAKRLEVRPCDDPPLSIVLHSSQEPGAPH
ncbi:hypothetical protein HIM_06763 [Hirsutella minnesotensis 3608]|uniref:Uncharacterized protein n=1 Tax=Hirsutella minnesotensis 3608 TaxID=1043627 RepID=A0A0F7ZNJ7_9HYPO|nr:hypothetical protein HIM_06763 [Hirsutella minnesotensis 3608]